jgi:hypothetical protein
MQHITALLHEYGIDGALNLLVPDMAEPVYYLAVPQPQATTLWQTLRQRVHHTGYWPILLGNAEEVTIFQDWLGEDTQREPPPQAQIATSLALDPHDSFQHVYTFNYGDEPEIDLPTYLQLVRGKWPAYQIPTPKLAVLSDPITHIAYESIALGLVPTTVSWQIPAFFYYGNWNGCPPTTTHCAILRYWEEQYGAEIVSAMHDTLELHVRLPPQTRDAALTLAEEQFAYCPDIVEQGVESVSALAAHLLDSPLWYFWWD